MLLPQTMVATPDWVAGQSPDAWLTARELSAWRGLPSAARRADRLAGRLAAKRLLREALRLDPLAREIGTDGVAPVILGPERARVNLSLSHSHGLGAAAWADTERQGTAGVDVQRIRPVHPRLAARILAPDEHRQLRTRPGGAPDAAGLLLFWTLKEAAIKTRRRRWARALREVEVVLGPPGIAAVLLPGEGALTAAYARIGGWWLARALRPPPG